MGHTKLLTTLTIAVLATACNKPITVQMWENEPDCLVEATYEAVDFWNKTLGKGAFELVVSNERICPAGRICIMMQPGKVPDHAHGRTSSHMRRRELYLAECSYYLPNTVAHEIGHAIRLRHLRGRKAGEKNLMYPVGGDKWELTEKQIDRAQRAWYFWFGRISL